MAVDSGTQLTRLDGTDYFVTRNTKSIGSGAQGSVIRAVHAPTKLAVAIKLIADHLVLNDHGGRVQTEIINHSRISHPHVVTFREALSLENHLGIALELCNAGGGAGAAARARFGRLNGRGRSQWWPRPGCAVAERPAARRRPQATCRATSPARPAACPSRWPAGTSSRSPSPSTTATAAG
jgi:hypothetical protein